ncbi:lipopolysaccharide biosynthesis protein [Smithella sp. F21]|nr:lipopolysaccharide biosynthesis protein [Smithella sp. F21]
MSLNLKQKTISGFTWSFIESIIGQGITFFVGIILARLLSPQEFGLIGMLTIFIALSQLLTDSGFSHALIRKQNCTQQDYSTVFYFNIVLGISLYILLFIAANTISIFFREPILKPLIRVIGLAIIINSFTIIQNTLLTKQINFKLQAKISVVSFFISGIISIYMAYTGWGVWSLVALTLFKYSINSVLLWFWNKWKPLWCFSKKSFVELFSFSGKLFVTQLIDALYRNLYYVIIGKYFSAAELGYYTRAEQFQSLPSVNLQGIIGRVSYPVLATMQNDTPRLRDTYKKLIRSTMLITFVLMLGMAASAKPMILSLVGEKWEPCIIYLQLLCFVGIFYPLSALNLNILYVKGRSDLALQIEIIKKMLFVPVFVLAVMWGIKIMILSMIILSLIGSFINSYWSGRLIGYSFFEQIKDITPSFLIAAAMSLVVLIEGCIIPLPAFPLFIIQLVSGALLTLGLCEGLRYKDYLYMKNIINDNFLHGAWFR